MSYGFYAKKTQKEKRFKEEKEKAIRNRKFSEMVREISNKPIPKRGAREELYYYLFEENNCIEEAIRKVLKNETYAKVFTREDFLRWIREAEQGEKVPNKKESKDKENYGR